MTRWKSWTGMAALAGVVGASAVAAGPVEVASQVAEVPVGRVLQGRHPAQEQLERVDVAGVGQREVALSLGEAVDDGVELLVLLRLVLAVRVDRQPERVLPLVPVVNLDALVAGVWVDVFRLDVGGCPVEVAREQSVPLPHRQLGLGHGSLLGSGNGAGARDASVRWVRDRRRVEAQTLGAVAPRSLDWTPHTGGLQFSHLMTISSSSHSAMLPL